MKSVIGNPRAARGVALLTALLVTAIVAIIAVGMASRQQLDIRRTGNVLDGDQAYLYALGVESWAQGVLRKDSDKDRRANAISDNTSESWATALPPIDVEGGKVAGVITDMMGRFNLNNLVHPALSNQQGQPTLDPAVKDVEIFKRLLTTVAGVKTDKALELVQAVQDWIDADDERRLNGAEEVDYLRLKPPYRTANAQLSSPSELLLIQGFTPEIYKQIAPYVATLQGGITTINVNTAATALIAALADGITAAQAEKLVSDRELRPFKNIQEFYVQLGLNPQQQQLITGKVAIASNYFLLSAQARTGRGQVQLYSLLERRVPPLPAPQVMNVKTIMRGQGTY
ncbi:MAG: type II secretion system minor pseudopilin GspK [Gammaproteobacteria bacterium]